MVSSKDDAATRVAQWEAGPLHVFAGRGIGVYLHVFSDHLELHFNRGNDVRAIWLRHVRRVFVAYEGGNEELVVVDRHGEVLTIPMTGNQLQQAHWLIASLIS
jgi:hypothetical protein